MDIKQTNVLFLLGKVKELIGSLPGEAKRGEKFIQAGKALERLDQIFGGRDEENQLVACRRGQPVLEGNGQTQLVACRKGEKAIPSGEIEFTACRSRLPIIDG